MAAESMCPAAMQQGGGVNTGAWLSRTLPGQGHLRWSTDEVPGLGERPGALLAVAALRGTGPAPVIAAAETFQAEKLRLVHGWTC